MRSLVLDSASTKYTHSPNTSQMFYKNSCCQRIDLSFNLSGWRDSCIVMIYFIIIRSTVSIVFVFCLFVTHLVIPNNQLPFPLVAAAVDSSRDFYQPGLRHLLNMSRKCQCHNDYRWIVSVALILIELSLNLTQIISQVFGTYCKSQSHENFIVALICKLYFAHICNLQVGGGFHFVLTSKLDFCNVFNSQIVENREPHDIFSCSIDHILLMDYLHNIDQRNVHKIFCSIALCWNGSINVNLKMST